MNSHGRSVVSFATWTLGLFCVLGGLGCQPVNVQDPNKKNTDDEQARTRREFRTPFSRFYGVYETIEQSGQTVTSRGHSGRTEVVCDTTTEIDNANISKYRTQPNGALKAETIVLDYFDPRTKEFLSADEIWVSSGAIRASSGTFSCGDFAVPVFAKRGQWKQLPDGFEYEFHGSLLKRVDGYEDRFETLQIDEVVRVRRMSQGMEVAIRYNSPRGAFDETWLVRSQTPLPANQR